MENPSPTLPEPPVVADFDALTRAARQERCLSENTLLAYQRAWRRLLAWSGASKLDPVTLTQEQAARFYREMVATSGRTAASSQVQARAAMAFAYEQWDRPNPFAKIKPPKSGSPPPVGYLQAHDLARLLDFLNQQQATYGESLTYHLAAALFYTCSRYSEIAHLRWNDCLLDGSGRIVALRIKGKGSVHSTLPVNAVLSEVLGEWRTIQEQHRGMKVFAARGLKFCRSEYVFAGPGGEPYTNQSFNAHLGRACKDLRLQTILTAHGLRHSAATILLNDQGKNLREVQEALRHRDIRTTARYTHVAPEHTRGTMDALGGSLPALSVDAGSWGEEAAKDHDTKRECILLERVQWCNCPSSQRAVNEVLHRGPASKKLREACSVQEADSSMRAAASVGSFELLQVLLKATQKLEKLGLRLDMRAGGVRITTAEVCPPALR